MLPQDVRFKDKSALKSISDPRATGGAYSAPQTLAGFKGPTSKRRGGEGKGKEGMRGKEGGKVPA